MLKAARKHIHTIIVLGVSAALVVVGVAAAQNIGGSSKSGAQAQGNGNGKGEQARKMHGPPPGGGPMGVPMRGLTYGEFHVQKNGEASVVRVDQGKIKSVDSSSITLEENDGSEVTIQVGSNTKVVGKPGSQKTVSDLKAGQKVIVSGPKGGTAKTIALPPKKGRKGPMKGDGNHPPRQGQGQNQNQGQMSPPGGGAGQGA